MSYKLFHLFPKSKYLRGKNNSDDALKGNEERIEKRDARLNEAYERIMRACNYYLSKSEPTVAKMKKHSEKLYRRHAK